MLVSKNINVLAFAIASSGAGTADSLLAATDEASSSYLKKKERERRRELLLAGMEQRMDLMKAESPEDEANVDPTTGADVGDLTFSDGDVDEIDGEEGRILAPNENACKKCYGDRDNENACKKCHVIRAPNENANEKACEKCDGKDACYMVPNEEGIGCMSCNADYACQYTESLINAGSCNAIRACTYAAGIIGQNSCNAHKACYGVWVEEDNGIGLNSCNAPYACAGYIGPIAPNTCNEPCECCKDSEYFGIICAQLCP